MKSYNMSGVFLQQAELQIEPTIEYNPSFDLGDDPLRHRWRATWRKSWDGNVVGVQLQAYPVVRKTACGAWIDTLAHYYHGAWDGPYDDFLRLVMDDSGQAWAKPTKQDAIDSLIYRHKRWTSRIQNDVVYFIQSTEMMQKLFPHTADQADFALASLARTVRNGKRD